MANLSQEPLTAEDAEILFAPLEQASGLVVGVSGGPDSTALMALLALWAMRPNRPEVVAATVDHGLRPSSRSEAEAVGRAAADCRISHRILTWEGEKPSSGLQEAAREARYRLLLDLAAQTGASHIVTAHTLDDQAETALIRLAGGSGLAGLAAMRPSVRRGGVVHVRPFLHVPKARLIATCDALGAFYVHDPSNEDTRYARVRWRHIMPVLAAEGLTARRLVALTERAARVEEALGVQAESLHARTRKGPGLYGIGPWLEAPFEIALRCLGLALAGIGIPHSGLGAPRLSRLEALTSAIRSHGEARQPMRRTLGGLLVTLSASGELSLVHEAERRRGLRKPVAREAGCDAGAPLASSPPLHKLPQAGQNEPVGGAPNHGTPHNRSVGRDT